MERLIWLQSMIDSIKDFEEFKNSEEIHLVYDYKDNKTLVIKNIHDSLLKKGIIYIINLTKNIEINKMGYTWIEVKTTKK